MKIVSIESLPESPERYDLEVRGLHNFVACNVVVHNSNARYVWSEDRLWVGSHHGIKKENDESLWWKIARKYNLADVLKNHPDIVIFGEAYGSVQDLKYGVAKNEFKLALFDAMNLKTRKYYDVDDFQNLVKAMQLPTVPILYKGLWNDDLREFAEGQSLIEGADHIREGCVIRPINEKWNDEIGRVILKLAGEGYLTRKEK